MRHIHLVFAGSLLLRLVGTAAADQPPAKESPKVSAEDIGRPILQLGDDNMAKRSQAKKQLEAGGEPAVAALKKAAESADDPEVRKAAKAIIEALAARAGGLLHAFDDHGNRVNGVAISADGKRAVSASWDGNLR